MSWRSDSVGMALLLSRPASEEEPDREPEPTDRGEDDRPDEPRDPKR